MPTQTRLFFDSPKHAIGCTIEFSEKSFEEVANHLWPTKPLRTAYARLKACVNDDKDEKLDFAEIIEVCRYCDRFDALFYFCDQCGFNKPEPLVKEDEAHKVRQLLLAGFDDIKRLAEELKRLEE